MQPLPPRAVATSSALSRKLHRPIPSAQSLVQPHLRGNGTCFPDHAAVFACGTADIVFTHQAGSNSPQSPMHDAAPRKPLSSAGKARCSCIVLTRALILRASTAAAAWCLRCCWTAGRAAATPKSE